MNDVRFHVGLVENAKLGRTVNVRHEGTGRWRYIYIYFFEMRKIVALQVLRSANRHVPERAKPIYYRARVIAIVLFAGKRAAAHNTARAGA